MRTIMTTLSLLSIFGIIFFILIFMAIFGSVEESDFQLLESINWNFVIPMTYIFGLIIIFTCCITMGLVLDKKSWENESKLYDKINKYNKAIDDYNDAKNKLAKYVLNQQK